MKNLLILLSFSFLVFSCNSGAEQAAEENTQTQTDTTAAAETTGPPEVPELMCFESREGNPANPDITTVRIIIRDGEVSGKMSWIPYQKDSAVGTLSGTQEADILKLRFDYTIEGSSQSEEMEFKLVGKQLIKKEGELEEKDGVLVLKNPSAATFSGTPLDKIDCNSAKK